MYISEKHKCYTTEQNATLTRLIDRLQNRIEERIDVVDAVNRTEPNMFCFFYIKNNNYNDIVLK